MSSDSGASRRGRCSDQHRSPCLARSEFTSARSAFMSVLRLACVVASFADEKRSTSMLSVQIKNSNYVVEGIPNNIKASVCESAEGSEDGCCLRLRFGPESEPRSDQYCMTIG